MNNKEIDKLKKRFLDGEITAIEYEAKVKVLENETKDIEIRGIGDVEVDSSVKKVDTSYDSIVITAVAVMIIIFVLFAINFRQLTPISSSVNNIENIIDTVSVELDSAMVVLTEDTLSRSERLAEEAAFMKTKAGRIYKKHPEWSKRDCERLAEGNIWIGMSIDMLKYKRGLPNSANPSNYGDGVTQWQWCWYDWTPSCFYDNDGDGLIDSYN